MLRCVRCGPFAQQGLFCRVVGRTCCGVTSVDDEAVF